MPPKPKSVLLRIYEQTHFNIQTGCWEWTGTRVNGYGRMTLIHGTNAKAHRIAYQALRGGLELSPPIGRDLDHLCRVRHCVNPWHLEMVSRGINLRRGEKCTSETCKRGHVRTPENTYRHPTKGWRTCRDCMRMEPSRNKAGTQ